MTATILVTGGTGALGSLVVPRLRAEMAEVRVLSRHEHAPQDGVDYVACDLLKGTDIDAALEGIDTILHLAGGPKGDDIATTRLVKAASLAFVSHIVLISVVGAETMPIGYFAAKRGAEEAVTASGIPWTIIRVAQVDTLVFTMVAAMGKLPVLPAPGGLRAQPVHPDDVAERLTELTLGSPAGLVPDLVGPQVYELADLAKSYLRAVGKRRMTLPIRLPGKIGRAYRAGENLTLEGATVGHGTWGDYLAQRLAAESAPTRERS